MEKCGKCDLSKTRKKVVSWRGRSDVGIMLIGEAPGPDEDEQGIPFIGRAGKFLDKMFAEVGFDTERCHISNTCRCFPGTIKPPTTDQVEACKPWLLKEIDIIKPRVIITLGLPAFKNLTGMTRATMGSVAGQVFKVQGIPCKIFSMYHPSWVLRQHSEAANELFKRHVKAAAAIYSLEY